MLSVMALAALAAGCSGSPTSSGGLGVVSGAGEPTGYLFHDTDQAAYIQWTKTGSHIAGTLQDAYVNPSDPTKVTTGTESLTGEISDGNITLTLDRSFLGATNLSGTFNGSLLVLGIPNNNGTINEVTFGPAAVSTYNKDADALNGDANRAQSAQQQVQRQTQAAQQKEQAAAAARAQVSQDQGQVNEDAEQVSQDISSLGSDDNFSSDVGGVATSLSEGQTDLTQTQSDATAEEAEAQQNPDGNSGQVCADASDVAADASDVASDASGVEASSSGVEDDVSSVRQDIKSIQADESTLQNDESTSGYEPVGAPTADTVNSAIGAANAAINSAVATTNGDISQAVNLFSSATAAATQASNAGDCDLATPSGPAGMTPIS
jgi:hypothetical protein